MAFMQGLLDTYKGLDIQGILRGSRKSKPIYTESNSSLSVDNASLIEINNFPLSANTESILLTIRNRANFGGNTNTTTIKIATLTLKTDGAKPVDFKIYKDSTIGGTFNYWDETNSRIEVNTNATLATTTETIGTITKIINQIGSTILSKEETQRINLLDGDIILDLKPSEEVTITAKSTNTSIISIVTRIKEK